jgi:ribosomal protein S12 methylthiotransferase accessory factor
MTGLRSPNPCIPSALSQIHKAAMVRFSALDLHSETGEELLAKATASASRQLAAVAPRLSRIFSIGSPFAPAFRCIGGEVKVDRIALAAPELEYFSVTGNGETLNSALISCLGEAAEHLSQFERPGDIAPEPRAGRHLAHLADGWIRHAVSSVEAGKSPEWVEARDASNDRCVLLPADLCFRRHSEDRVIQPIGALSSGVAAGPTFEAAAVRAVLELCERDAAALWWLGGRRPKCFSAGHPVHEAANALLERLRQGVSSRQNLLLNITTDTGVPAVAAVSVDHNGRNMACGVAARGDWPSATSAAILEMCQMEMAATVAEMKRAEGGEGKLNETDRRHLRRAAFDTTSCALLHPHEELAPEAYTSLARNELHEVVNVLTGRNIRLFLIELTRKDLDIPVVRAVSPDLQPFSRTATTTRFINVWNDTGGGDRATAGTPLL